MSDPMSSMSAKMGSTAIVETDPAQRSLAMIAHIAGLFGIVGSGIWYFIKKSDPKTGPFALDQMKESVNYQITFIIVWIVAIIATVLVTTVAGFISGTIAMILGLVMFAVLGIILIAHLAFIIMNALKANKGMAARYPFSIKIIK